MQDRGGPRLDAPLDLKNYRFECHSRLRPALFGATIGALALAVADCGCQRGSKGPTVVALAERVPNSKVKSHLSRLPRRTPALRVSWDAQNTQMYKPECLSSGNVHDSKLGAGSEQSEKYKICSAMSPIGSPEKTPTTLG
jgi:hypothetical protein